MKGQKLEVRSKKSEIRRVLSRGLSIMLYGLLIGVCGLWTMDYGLSAYAKEPEKIIGYDDFGRKIILNSHPKRIVVLSGSHIPIIYELGCGERIVGVPNSIISSMNPPHKSSYPGLIKKYPSLLEKETVGDFSSPNIEKIVSLKPDLIIIYDSSDKPGKYSSIFDKNNIAYAAFTTAESIEFGLSQIKRLGILLGKKEEGKILANRLKKEITQIASNNKNKPLVWWCWGKGPGTYGRKVVIDELISKAGGRNLAHDFDKGWFEISLEYVIAKNPDVIITSCWQEDEYKTNVEALKSDPRLSQIKAIKNNRIYAMDGHKFHCPIRYPEIIAEMMEVFK